MPIVSFEFSRISPEPSTPAPLPRPANRYYIEHREAIKQYKKVYMKEYYVKNKEKIQYYQKQYRHSQKIIPRQ